MTPQLSKEAAKAIQNLPQSEFWDVFEEELKEGSEDGARRMLIERCRYDVETFTLAFFPHYCEHPFNKFHRDCFKDWQEHSRKMRRADAAPRGAAKSTLKALIKPIHDLCYGLETFIVVISETAAQAAGKLKDIRTELLDNNDLLAYYGPFFDAKKVSETAYVANCHGHKCKFEAHGSGAQVRGIRFGAHRPSKIIIDDGESSEEVLNEELRSKKEKWFKEDITKLGNEKTNIEVIGTILHRDSLLSNLFQNPSYESRKYKTVLNWSEREDLWEKWRNIYNDLDNPNRGQDAYEFYLRNEAEMLRGAEILWPERESYLDLMKEMVEIGRSAFMKERQNEPGAGDESIFTRLWWFEEVADGLKLDHNGKVIPWSELQIQGAFGTMDPATGQTKPKAGRKSDFTSIVSGYTDTKGRLFVYNDWTKRVSPSDFIQAMFELNDVYEYSKFGIETNLYRNLIMPNILQEKKRREKERKEAGRNPWGIQVSLYDIENVENKLKRIHALEPKVTNGYILLNKSLSTEFRNQLEAFPDPGAHDDCPDALEMLWGLVNNRYSISEISLNVQGK